MGWPPTRAINNVLGSRQVFFACMSLRLRCLRFNPAGVVLRPPVITMYVCLSLLISYVTYVLLMWLPVHPYVGYLFFIAIRFFSAWPESRAPLSMDLEGALYK